jgi:hypothetical protein
MIRPSTTVRIRLRDHGKGVGNMAVSHSAIAGLRPVIARNSVEVEA